MITLTLLAFVYVGQLGLKVGLAWRYGRQAARTQQAACADSVTILQPILSGDPSLSDSLAANLMALPTAKFIWLVDDDDPEGNEIVRAVADRFQRVEVKIVSCAPVPARMNPKAHKLALALPLVTTPVLVVLDDDTRLGARALAAMLAGLENGATLATGLPRYNAAEGRCSGWLAEFVNSAAVLTYLPALAFSEPLTIHGMCYAMRTEEARRMDVFTTIAPSLTDDLALAIQLRRRGERIYQTVEPHDIATSVESWTALGRILKRWFVFARLLTETCEGPVKLGLVVAYVLPPLILGALLVLACGSWLAATVGVAVLVVRDGLLRGIKRRFLGAAVPHRAFASLVLEVVQPALMVVAWLSGTIQWRSRRIRVRGVMDFELV